MAITRSEKSVSKPISTPAVRPIKWKEVLGKVIVYILLTTGAIIFFCTLGMDGLGLLSAHRADF